MPDGVDDGFALEALRNCALFARPRACVARLCLPDAGPPIPPRRDDLPPGRPGDSLFVIYSGAVKIVLPSPEGEEAAIIATLSRGDFFGELALLDGAYRSATAVAVEPTETLVLRREPFEQLIDTDADMRKALLAGLAAELRRLTGHVEELHFLDLPGRLARRLVRMAEELEPGVTGEAVMKWPFTQSELAAMIGGTRQTVNRLLADFIDQGLVRFERDVLVIPSVERLAAAAER